MILLMLSGYESELRGLNGMGVVPVMSAVNVSRRGSWLLMV